MLPLPRMYPRRLERDGSGRQAECHQRCLDYRRSHSPAGISRLRSGRRSRCFVCKATRCRRLHANSGGRRRQSLASCGATLPPEAAASSIARQQRNGTPSEPLAAQSWRSLHATQLCGPMWRNDWLASSSLQAGLLFAARRGPSPFALSCKLRKRTMERAGWPLVLWNEQVIVALADLRLDSLAVVRKRLKSTSRIDAAIAT